MRQLKVEKIYTLSVFTKVNFLNKNSNSIIIKNELINFQVY